MKLTFLIFFVSIFQFSAISQQVNNDTVEYLCPPCNNQCDSLSFKNPGICPHCSMKLITKNEINNKVAKSKRVAFYLQEGVEVLDFAGPMEVFSYAGYEVFVVSKSKEAIKSQGIMTIIPDYSIDDVPKADILAFFGGNAENASKDPEVIEWVRAQEGVDHYFSVCTGAFILAEAGMLKDKTATTFHNALDYLEQNFPETKVLKNVRYVDNGNVITTAGISAGIDGALHLVAKLQGFNAARNVAYYMEYDKWVPGEGLDLSEVNPYKSFTDTDLLNEYSGIYKFTDNATVELQIDENQKSLVVFHEGRIYPLFYQEKDLFTLPEKKTVIFERDGKHRIIGFRTSHIDDTLFEKIK